MTKINQESKNYILSLTTSLWLKEKLVSCLDQIEGNYSPQEEINQINALLKEFNDSLREENSENCVLANKIKNIKAKDRTKEEKDILLGVKEMPGLRKTVKNNLKPVVQLDLASSISTKEERKEVDALKTDTLSSGLKNKEKYNLAKIKVKWRFNRSSRGKDAFKLFVYYENGEEPIYTKGVEHESEIFNAYNHWLESK